jgi:hypothetical protein
LFYSEFVNVFRLEGINWAKRDGLSIKAMLGEQHKSSQGHSVLEHEAIMLIASFYSSLSTRAEKDRGRGIGFVGSVIRGVGKSPNEKSSQ